MRPTGETHLALMQVAHAFKAERAKSGQGATLQEMVRRSQVGQKVGRAMVAKLKERGHLVKVGERKVDYRNRPVAEYAPADLQPDLASGPGWVDLGNCLQSWTR